MTRDYSDSEYVMEFQILPSTHAVTVDLIKIQEYNEVVIGTLDLPEGDNDPKVLAATIVKIWNEFGRQPEDTVDPFVITYGPYGLNEYRHPTYRFDVRVSLDYLESLATVH